MARPTHPRAGDPAAGLRVDPRRRLDLSSQGDGRDPRPRGRPDDRDDRRRVTFPNPGNLLRPGQYGKVRLRHHRDKRARSWCRSAPCTTCRGSTRSAWSKRTTRSRCRPCRWASASAPLGDRQGPEAGRARDRRGAPEGEGRRVKVAPTAAQAECAEVGSPPESATVSRFFVRRPIVAIVISILTVLLGVVAHAPAPDRAVTRTSCRPRSSRPGDLLGADALTIEQSVATPIEQQMSGVDDMIYMYSVERQQRRPMTLRVNFDVGTDPNTDQMLAQMRYSQARVAAARRTCATSASRSRSRRTSPLAAVLALLAERAPTTPSSSRNYAYININDPMTRVPGIGQVHGLRRRPVRDAPLGAPGHARAARASPSPRSSPRSRRRTP